MQSEAESAIRALHYRLLEAWNDRDPAAYAGLMTHDAEVVGFDGSQMCGAAEIERTLARIFADHDTAEYVSIVRSVRFLRPDVASLRAVAGMVPRGDTDLDPAVTCVQMLVAVLGEAGWRIAAFQNTPAAFHGRPAEREALTRELREALAFDLPT